jgi:hypothetical protein
MNRRILAFLFTFAAGAVFGQLAVSFWGARFGDPSVVMAQTHKPLFMTRIYTGPDNQTHAEQVELKFSPGKPTEVFKMMQVNGAELHRAKAGNVEDWHRAPRRQYVISISGHAEIEVAGGKKITAGPGNIDLVEDTSGKGHITRVIGTEDRVTLQIPLVDQSGR